MLPATFDSDPQFRVSKSVLGIFAVAILTAGFSFTGLLSFAVRNPLFHADAIFLPSLASCAIGLLTIFYDFLTSSRYVWNTPALLLIIAASLSTIVYGALLVYTYRKISIVRSHRPPVGMQSVPLRQNSMSSERALWQDPGYYENYVRNMFPTSTHQPSQTNGFDPSYITEEEMQRQQMLMLLLHKEQSPTPDPTQSTFRIDWQGQEQDDLQPAHGYYAPQPNSGYPPSSAYPMSALSRRFTNEQLQQPWDGVWRGPAPAPMQVPGRGRAPIEQWSARATSRDRREERRREIELGR